MRNCKFSVHKMQTFFFPPISRQHKYFTLNLSIHNPVVYFLTLHNAAITNNQQTNWNLLNNSIFYSILFHFLVVSLLSGLWEEQLRPSLNLDESRETELGCGRTGEQRCCVCVSHVTSRSLGQSLEPFRFLAQSVTNPNGFVA